MNCKHDWDEIDIIDSKWCNLCGVFAVKGSGKWRYFKPKNVINKSSYIKEKEAATKFIKKKRDDSNTSEYKEKISADNLQRIELLKKIYKHLMSGKAINPNSWCEAEIWLLT